MTIQRLKRLRTFFKRNHSGQHRLNLAFFTHTRDLRQFISIRLDDEKGSIHVRSGGLLLGCGGSCYTDELAATLEELEAFGKDRATNAVDYVCLIARDVGQICCAIVEDLRGAEGFDEVDFVS